MSGQSLSSLGETAASSLLGKGKMQAWELCSFVERGRGKERMSIPWSFNHVPVSKVNLVHKGRRRNYLAV